MHRMVVSFLFVFLYLFSFAQPAADKLDAYFNTAHNKGIFNGSVLIIKGNEVILKKGYGFQNAKANKLNTDRTIFQVGSVTKQFTATVILKLAEQGRISLNDKLFKYFPDFPNAQKISVENLLCHTSGIYNYTNNDSFWNGELDKPVSQAKMLSQFKYKPLDFEPGTDFNYSNSGYLLLGYIIEKVTGKQYEEMVTKLIFEPLQMAHSGFDFTNLSSPDKAVGYRFFTDTLVKESIIVDSTVSYSAGAIYTNLDDLNKWNQSLFTAPILKPASLKNAFTPRLYNYALGWRVDTVYGRRRINHDGGIHGFLANNTLLPQDSLRITLLSNCNSTKLDQVSKDVLAILYNKYDTVTRTNTEINIDTAILNKYVGQYELTPAFSITISIANGQLKLQATNQPQFDIYAKSETLFYLKVVDAQVEFVKNITGVVEKLILHQNGMDLPGKKVK